mmetsp:Transcript_87888/g.188551  ORF Transcript_87888/g.188551 Transcript_87888/m.188551 type:complete len:211 (+) Transcript_87888:343-975(+)
MTTPMAAKTPAIALRPCTRASPKSRGFLCPLDPPCRGPGRARSLRLRRPDRRRDRRLGQPLGMRVRRWRQPSGPSVAHARTSTEGASRSSAVIAVSWTGPSRQTTQTSSSQRSFQADSGVWTSSASRRPCASWPSGRPWMSVWCARPLQGRVAPHCTARRQSRCASMTTGALTRAPTRTEASTRVPRAWAQPQTAASTLPSRGLKGCSAP